jgi:hypothetical protein
MSRFYLVVGTPTGGTSAVAGVLHHLGVDMGDLSAAHEGAPGQRRPYHTYECREFRRVCMRNRPVTVEKVAGYVMERQRYKGVRQTRIFKGKQSQGVKHPQTCRLGRFDADALRPLVDLGVCLVRVERPLTDILRGDARYHGRRMRPDYLRSMFHDLEALCIAWPGEKLIVRYPMLTADPSLVVRGLAAQLCFEPTEAAIEAAIGHVDPSMNHARKEMDFLVRDTDGTVRPGRPGENPYGPSVLMGERR